MTLFLFARLEETVVSTWIRETGWVFFSSLTLHSLSLALVVGVSLVILWRETGFAAGIPPRRLAALIPMAKLGLVLVILSGLLLLLAYPAKALTNSVFYLKLLAITGALIITRLVVLDNAKKNPEPGLPGQHRRLAGIALALWIISIGSGRFLAYTHNILLASSFY